jgi:hypothetical protein
MDVQSLANVLYAETRDLRPSATAPDALSQARQALAAVIQRANGRGFKPPQDPTTIQFAQDGSLQVWRDCEAAAAAPSNLPLGPIVAYDDQALTTAKALPALAGIVANQPVNSFGPFSATDGKTRYIYVFAGAAGVDSGRYPLDASDARSPKTAGAGPSALRSLVVFAGLTAAFVGSAYWVFYNARFGATPDTEPLLLWMVITAVLVAFFLFTGWIVGDRIDAVLIQDNNRISLSRFQLVAWTILLLGGYLTLAMWDLGVWFHLQVLASGPAAAGHGVAATAHHVAQATAVSGGPTAQQTAHAAGSTPADGTAPFPTMSKYLWGLLGIVNITPLVSNLVLQPKKAINVSDADADALKAVSAPTDVTTNLGGIDARSDPSAAQWTDLFTGEEVANRNTVDVSRVQQFIVTLLLLTTYAMLLGSTLSNVGRDALTNMPDISETFLALLGISHGAYLAAKATPKPVPSSS